MLVLSRRPRQGLMLNDHVELFVLGFDTRKREVRILVQTDDRAYRTILKEEQVGILSVIDPRDVRIRFEIEDWDRRVKVKIEAPQEVRIFRSEIYVPAVAA
jgi:sRNA-binding carbon storage regulator CsrA